MINAQCFAWLQMQKRNNYAAMPKKTDAFLTRMASRSLFLCISCFSSSTILDIASFSVSCSFSVIWGNIRRRRSWSDTNLLKRQHPTYVIHRQAGMWGCSVSPQCTNQSGLKGRVLNIVPVSFLVTNGANPLPDKQHGALWKRGVLRLFNQV